MSQSNKPMLRSLSLDQTAKVVEQHAKEQGIKTLVTTGNLAQNENPVALVETISTAAPAKSRARGKGSKAQSQTQSPVRRMAIDLPVYLISAIRKQAAEDETTIRYVITRALRKDGFTVEAQDLIEDGRRER